VWLFGKIVAKRLLGSAAMPIVGKGKHEVVEFAEVF